MDKLKLADLWKLEDYAEARPAFRRRVLDHKKHRKVHLGENVTLLFEDRLTIQYQVQEMLRIERIYEKVAIQEELDAYNPLIPDGRNWKATLLIEFEDPAVRAVKLAELRGLERALWLEVGDLPRVHAIADEDLERATETKTSAVHFLRFEVGDAGAKLLQDGIELRFGVSHPQLTVEVQVPEETRRSLIADLA
jgi:hypothetical protein